MSRGNSIEAIAKALGIEMDVAGEIRAAAIANLSASYRKAAKSSMDAAVARSVLPPGSSRAKVTSANARWMRNSEAATRLLMALEALGVTP